MQGSRVRLKELSANPDIVVTDRPSVPFRHVYDIDLLNSPIGLVASTDQFSPQQQLCGVWSPADSPPPIHSCSTADMVPEIARPLHGDDFVLVLETIPGATLRVFAWDGELGNGVGGTIGLTRPLVGGEILIATQSLPPCPVVNQGFSITVAPP